MKSSIIKIISLLIICAVSLTAVTGCSKSFLIPDESTTKAEYDEAAARAEYERTSIPGSETEAETTEEETEEATTSQITTAQATTEEQTEEESSISETITELTSAIETAVETTKHVINTENKTTETKSDYKYGVKKIDVVSTYYDIYSDGTKVENRTKSRTYTKYDYSGFSATTSELMSEANSNKTAYAAQATSAIAAVNALRSSNLTADSGLTTAACVRATEMAYSGKVNGTTRPNGSNWNTVLTDCGLTASSSTIDFVCNGYSDGSSAVSAISGTSSNKTKMTDSRYKKIGVGFAKNPEGMMYCCIIVSE